MWPWQSPAYKRPRLLRFARNDTECNPIHKKMLCGARKWFHTQIAGSQYFILAYQAALNYNIGQDNPVSLKQTPAKNQRS